MKISDFSIEALARILIGEGKITPYMSGPKLVTFFNNFGIRDVYTYESGGGLPERLSRTKYTINRIKVINECKEMKPMVEALVDARRLESNNNQIDVVNAVNEIIKHDGYKLEDIGDSIYKVVGDELSEELEIEVHFEDIQNQILEQLSLAKYTIWIAVAWFTNPILFQKLIEKKKKV